MDVFLRQGQLAVDNDIAPVTYDLVKVYPNPFNSRAIGNSCIV